MPDTKISALAAAAAAATGQEVPVNDGGVNKKVTLQQVVELVAATVLARLDVDNLRLDGNSLSATNENGNVVVAPNGTGQVALGSGVDLGLQRKSGGQLRVTNAGGSSGGQVWAENFYVETSGTAVMELVGNGLGFANGKVLWFGSAGGVQGSGDVGLARDAAGVLRITNGSTGYGRVRLAAGVDLIAGAGSPEGSVTAGVGSMYLRSDGGILTTLYIKESGAGNTGWAAK